MIGCGEILNAIVPIKFADIPRKVLPITELNY